MANLTFGSTIRANTAIGIRNNTTSNLSFGLLRVTTLAPNAVEFLSFNTLDQRIRSNPEGENLYTVNSDGVKPYLDDVNEFCKLIKAGTISVLLTTQNVTSTTYVAGASATYTSTADGSITFS
jgi:hypothetical protein